MTDPRRSLPQVDNGTPFLLLPLRLETRFVGSELWIRAFPDDVAITAHEPALTAAEIDQGKEFWRTSWTASAAVRTAAWTRLVGGGATTRAAWIAAVTHPLDPQPAPLRFPDIATKASAWTTAARSEIMPDQLVFSLYANGTLVHQVVGAGIPTPLPVGPDPTVEIVRDASGNLVLDDAIAWIVDFDRAIQIGLAVKIPLTAAETAAGFDRLTVLGVRLSADPASDAKNVAALVQAHRYHESLELVPQGTPTNHTDHAAAGGGRETIAEALDRELGPPRFVPASDPDARSDGERLAAALGIPATAIDHTGYSERRDHAEAVAMNRALWPATLGYFAEQMMSPQITDQARAEIRAFFTRFVTGRGALPAVKIGNQPYGVLVTGAFSRWRPAPGDSATLGAMTSVLDRMAATWTTLARSVARAGATSDPERAIIDMLGLQASSITYDYRGVVGPEYVWNADALAGADPNVRLRTHQTAATSLVQSLGFHLDGVRALSLSLLRGSATMNRPLIDTQPLSETRGLDPNYIEWLRGPIDAIRSESYGAPAPSALLYILLRHAVLLATLDAATNVLVNHGLADASDRLEREIVNVRNATEPTRWDQLDAKIPNVTANLAVADYVRATPGPSEAAALREQLVALEVLAPLPTARLERLLTEHVDLCSYRLDAWRLGLAARRLDTMRTTVPTGVHVGAYGWLEDVRPRAQSADGGFVHAPSPAHAVTAAILRSAHVSHRDQASDARMSIDLRSSRVRRALGYVDGLRAGHELAEMLGIRFERGLHDRNPALALEQYIARLRAAFPLVAGRVHATTADETIDAVQARQVVDGVRLLERRPDGYPYGAIGLPAAGTAEANAIVTEVDTVADDMDALADVLLAESVHQAAQGKHERANAAATGLARGIVPPDLEVVAAPRSGLAVVHRICLLLSHASTQANWPGVTPRSSFEPALDAWIGSVLGSPDSLGVRVVVGTTAKAVRAGELGLHPIDLVYLTGADPPQPSPALSRWVERIVRARNGIGADVAVSIDLSARDPAWDASVRTFGELGPLLSALHAIVRSRAAHAQDLSADDADQGQDSDELRSRIEAALADLQVAITQPDRAALWGLSSATDALADLHARVTRAVGAAATSATPLAAYVEAARLLFGDQMNPLPRFTAANPAELKQAIGAPALLANAPASCAEEWLCGVARVRTGAAALETVSTMATAFGNELSPFEVAQLPHDPAARWLGLELEPTTPRDGRALSLVAQVDNGLAFTEPMVGIVIDELTDLIPSTHEITGLTFQQHRPASEPPQALLLVVPSSLGGGWDWTDLHQAVVDTFELAKLRAVEPDAIAGTSYAQFLPAVVAPRADRNATITLSFEVDS